MGGEGPHIAFVGARSCPCAARYSGGEPGKRLVAREGDAHN